MPKQTSVDQLIGSKTEPPIINVGTGVDLTIRELAETVMRVVGVDAKIEFDATKPDGTPRKVLDVSKLLALGWRARTSLEAGLEKAYADFLRHSDSLVSS